MAQVFGPGPRRLGLHASRILIGIGSVLFAAAFFRVVPPHKTLLPFQLTFALALPFGFLAPIRATLRGESEGLIFTAGLTALFALGLIDVGMAVGVVPRVSVGLVHWGLAACIASLATILGQRFVRVHRHIAQLKSNLETILVGTREVAGLHEKIPAVTCILRFIVGHVRLQPCWNATLALPDTAEGEDADACKKYIEVVLVHNGETLSSQEIRVLVPSHADCAAVAEAFGAARSYLDGAGNLRIPLISGGTARGVLTLSPLLNPSLLPEEVHFVDALATSLALALSNIDFLAETADKARLEGEIRAAELVQSTLLPKEIRVPNLEMASFYRAAAQVSGDWYGYHFDQAGRRLFLFVGDVTGHGLASALLTGVVCGAIYASERRIDGASRGLPPLSTEQRLEELARAVNGLVYETGRCADRLMTMLFACLHIDTGEVHVLNAAHNNPFHVCTSTAGRRANPVKGRGNRLGHSTDLSFTLTRLQLAPGDMLFFYTDGLIENAGPDGARLSPKELRMVLESCHSLQDVQEKVVAAYNEVCGSVAPEDDVSMLSVRWVPGAD